MRFIIKFYVFFLFIYLGNSYSQPIFFIEPLLHNKLDAGYSPAFNFRDINTPYFTFYQQRFSKNSLFPNIALGCNFGVLFLDKKISIKGGVLGDDGSSSAFRIYSKNFSISEDGGEIALPKANIILERKIVDGKQFLNFKNVYRSIDFYFGINWFFNVPKSSTLTSGFSTRQTIDSTKYFEVSVSNVSNRTSASFIKKLLPSIGVNYTLSTKSKELFTFSMEYMFAFSRSPVYSVKQIQVDVYDSKKNTIVEQYGWYLLGRGAGLYFKVSRKIQYKKRVKSNFSK